LNDPHEDEALKRGNRKWRSSADEDEDDLSRKGRKKDSGKRSHRRKTPKDAFWDEVADD